MQKNGYSYLPAGVPGAMPSWEYSTPMRIVSPQENNVHLHGKGVPDSLLYLGYTKRTQAVHKAKSSEITVILQPVPPSVVPLTEMGFTLHPSHHSGLIPRNLVLVLHLPDASTHRCLRGYLFYIEQRKCKPFLYWSHVFDPRGRCSVRMVPGFS